MKETECDICGGTGFVESYILDPDSHNWQPTDRIKCTCQIKDEDMSGATEGDR